ncbi:hypothetical protein ADUPG1_006091 [Aduncisulcus paluster]|uniref:Protein kinase domain-containing protein n=1 Tax=Aduncisulcus paluster TaxID=2918883 RepID=A0ABQ5KJT7_9EUKA|nr:hypothetical protein ADUPG1_006091 [Aduncisulcus paluster]
MCLSCVVIIQRNKLPCFLIIRYDSYPSNEQYGPHQAYPSRKGAYLVFPYYAHRDMFYWINNTHPDFEAVKHVLTCVLSALAHLHSQFIVHCDLKPTNILIDSFGNGILCDFEGSVDCSERTMRLLSQTMYVGTPGYCS